jgi:F0F1-type ATP synthase assembly protein I
VSKKKSQNQDKSTQLNNYARLSGIAFQMIAIIAVGTFIGIKLDEKFPNKHDLYTLILTLSSVIISIVYVIRRIIASSKDTE